MTTIEKLQDEYLEKESSIPITVEMHDNDDPVICPICYERRAMKEHKGLNE